VATADIYPTVYGSTDGQDTDFHVPIFECGEVYTNSKSTRRRPVQCFDLSAYAGWTISAAELRGNVYTVSGTTGFACTLRRVLESFTEDFTWDTKDGSNAWANAGPSTPGSATDTGKVAFTSPTTKGDQALVADVLALVEDAIANRSNLFLFVAQPDNDNPGATADFTLRDPAAAYLRLTVTRRLFAQVV